MLKKDKKDNNSKQEYTPQTDIESDNETKISVISARRSSLISAHHAANSTIMGSILTT